MLGTVGVGSDEGQVNVGGGHTRKVDLCLLGSLFNALHSHFIAGKIDTILLFKGVDHPVHNALVEVVTAQTVVTGRCKDLLNAVAHFDYGHIECAAAKIINHNLLVGFLVDAICKSGCGRLVNNTFDLKACNLACILCGLTLRIGEVCGNGDDRLGHLVAKIAFCVGFKLLKNDCRNFLRGKVLAVDIDLSGSTHISLNR